MKQEEDIAVLETAADGRNVGAAEEEPIPGNKAWNRVVDKISYKGMVKNMPYLIFLTLLAIIYIANNNHAIGLVRQLDVKKKELKQLRWRYMDLQSRLMYQTSESQLKLKTEALGLKPLKEPAFEIRVKQTKKEEK